MLALRRGVHIGAVVNKILGYFDLIPLGSEIQQRLEIIRAVVDSDPWPLKVSVDLAEVLTIDQGQQMFSRRLRAGRRPDE